ncbi:hypothetical protein GCM10009800_35120 [Nocardiopsis rhodophaea]
MNPASRRPEARPPRRAAAPRTGNRTRRTFTLRRPGATVPSPSEAGLEDARGNRTLPRHYGAIPPNPKTPGSSPQWGLNVACTDRRRRNGPCPGFRSADRPPRGRVRGGSEGAIEPREAL